MQFALYVHATLCMLPNARSVHAMLGAQPIVTMKRHTLRHDIQRATA